MHLLNNMKSYIFSSLLLLLVNAAAIGQGRIILNGGNIAISGGAFLIVANPSATAITRLSTGGKIISEGENNRIKWLMGTQTGFYVIPWGYNDSTYMPLQFIKQAGTGSGYFIFATYHTDWENSQELPTGVSNLNNEGGSDNSPYSVDRFWRIEALNYTVKPTLLNVRFTYLENEFDLPNAINESSLTAQRYNDVLNSWVDATTVSTIDIVNNTVTVSQIAPSNSFPWWQLSGQGVNRYWIAQTSSVWDDPANWSYNPNGAGGAAVPGEDDAVFFNCNSAACTVNNNYELASLSITSDYNDTISLGSNMLVVENDVTFSGGNIQGGASTIKVGGNFTLSGASFTAPSELLEIGGNFTMTNGTFNHNDGTIKFSGNDNVTQTLSSNIIRTFNNIEVTNNSVKPGLRILNSQNLKGVLTLGADVEVDTDGITNAAVFKLLSTGDNPTADAAIGILPAGAAITGKVTVQRYMAIEGPSNGRIYRYIGSPIQNATVADIQNEIKVTGTFTGTSKCNGCGTSASMFAYNESLLTDINNSGGNDMNDGYYEFPDASNLETLTPGRGYAIYVRGSIMTSALWDVTGNINTGNVTDISFPVTFTTSGAIANDGWNLVANPFPSAINWIANSGWSKTNLGAAIYTTDNGGVSTQFATYNGIIGLNGGSEYIATGQAFWVKASTDNPVLSANENVKAPGIETTFFRKSSFVNLLKIKLSKGTTRDESVIHFRDDATNGFDPSADALKMMNATFNLSTLLADGRKLAINSLAAFNCGMSVRMAIDNAAAGSYRLDFTELDSFSDNISIQLVDSLLNKTIDIRLQPAYTFAVTSNPLSFGSNRFRVVFSVPSVTSDFALVSNAVCEGVNPTINITNAQNGVNYTAMLGSTPVSETMTASGSTLDLNISTTSLVLGSNTITVKVGVLNCTTSAEKDVDITVLKTFSPLLVVSTVTCDEGNVTLTASGAPANGYYNWYDSESAQLPITNQHSAVFVTPYLYKSATYFASIVSAQGCEGPKKSVLADVVATPQVSIARAGDFLESNYAEGNQWYFNQEIMNGATSEFIKPRQSGIYGLTVSIKGCAASSEYVMEVALVTDIETTEGNDISVFPNPVLENVYIKIPQNNAVIREVRLINIQGQHLKSFSITNFHGNYEGQFSMREYPSGLYFIEVVGDKSVTKIKVLKL
jgi:hypothetical protein